LTNSPKKGLFKKNFKIGIDFNLLAGGTLQAHSIMVPLREKEYSLSFPIRSQNFIGLGLLGLC
jgi:hypothetical protein